MTHMIIYASILKQTKSLYTEKNIREKLSKANILLSDIKLFI